jgi:GT2 family glycosyltransferase
MKKCDVIIPVYNAPQWVKLCVYALIKNTDESILNKIYLMDDCSNVQTKQLLKNLTEKYKTKICLVENEKNLGFVKNCNNALKLSTSDYVLLLNTDCIITKGTIEKLISHMDNNEKIGLICPISSNAANLTLDMFDGFTFSQMNNLLENKFYGMDFDACTVVGNCLMISRNCINKVGLLDEIYGFGYGEETDYQFKAMQNGFEAKVAIDTYVFHKSEASFGISKQKKERLEHNRKIFFSRWSDEYNKLLAKYEANNPITYIKNNLTSNDMQIDCDTVFYLPDLVQNAGGVHVVVDMVNYLSINNVSCNILYNNISNYQEIILFNPIQFAKSQNAKMKQIVSTIFNSTFMAKRISIERNIPLIYFVQGYETLFENGGVYGIVELSYKLSDYILSISNYLHDELLNTFQKDSIMINNGINYDLLHFENENKEVKNITMTLRNSPMKGDWVLFDVLKKITTKFNNLTINIIYMNDYAEFPFNNNKTITINKFLGPLSREKVSSILRTSDVFIDASMNEGFGLMPLEAMAAGCVVITSDSFGIRDYLKNEKNSYVIEEVNDSDKYVEKLEILLKNKDKYQELKKESMLAPKKFDYDDVVDKYIEYFNQDFKITTKDNTYNDTEVLIMNAANVNTASNTKIRSKVYFASKLIPKSVKQRIKKLINALYNTYQH